MKKLFAIFLIILGSFLEVFYYAWRFTNDGIETWLAIVIGIALTLFLCMAVLYRNNLLTKFLIIALVIYSILATSAGQSFSLSLFQEKETEIDIKEQYNQDEIKDLQYRINQIDEKYQHIQDGIDITIQSLHNRGQYRTTLAAAEDKQKELNEERALLQERLSELRLTAISHDEIEQKKTNIYGFYNTLSGFPVKWLQFIFQTILSVFIAIMAPLGIIIMQAKRERRKYKKRKKEIKLGVEYWRPLIEQWVHANWIGRRTGKSNNILPKSTFMAFTAAHGKSFTNKQYTEIKKAAETKKCIDRDVIIVHIESEAIKRIIQEVCDGRNKKRTNQNQN